MITHLKHLCPCLFEHGGGGGGFGPPLSTKLTHCTMSSWYISMCSNNILVVSIQFLSLVWAALTCFFASRGGARSHLVSGVLTAETLNTNNHTTLVCYTMGYVHKNSEMHASSDCADHYASALELGNVCMMSESYLFYLHIETPNFMCI